MHITQRQYAEVERHLPAGRNPLKALDEYTYCRYTKRLNDDDLHLQGNTVS